MSGRRRATKERETSRRRDSLNRDRAGRGDRKASAVGESAIAVNPHPTPTQCDRSLPIVTKKARKVGLSIKRRI